MQQKTAPALNVSLVQNLLSKLPPSSNIFTESKAASQYDNDAVSKDFNFRFLETDPQSILNILKCSNSSNPRSINNFPGKFLKDGADILQD